MKIHFKNKYWGPWVALVKHPTLDFSSWHDLMVHEFEPHVGFSPFLSAPFLHSLSLSLKINLKEKNKTKTKKKNTALSTQT